MCYMKEGVCREIDLTRSRARSGHKSNLESPGLLSIFNVRSSDLIMHTRSISLFMSLITLVSIVSAYIPSKLTYSTLISRPSFGPRVDSPAIQYYSRILKVEPEVLTPHQLRKLESSGRKVFLARKAIVSGIELNCSSAPRPAMRVCTSGGCTKPSLVVPLFTLNLFTH